MPRWGRGDGGMMSADRSRGTRARGANRRGGDEDARVAASKSGNSFVDQFDARAARERDARRRGTHRADRIPLVELALPHARREGLFFAFFGHVRRLTRTWGERARARSSAEDAPVSRARLRFVVRLLKVPDEPPTTVCQTASPARVAIDNDFHPRSDASSPFRGFKNSYQTGQDSAETCTLSPFSFALVFAVLARRRRARSPFSNAQRG